MACECSTWDHYLGTGVMMYQTTCILSGHADLGREQQAKRDAADDLSRLRRKWRSQLKTPRGNAICSFPSIATPIP
jgi:hypothetical protein